MKDLVRAIFCWLPRLIVFFAIFFVSRLAFNVLEQDLSLGQTILAVSIRLAPAFVLLTFLVIAWRWPATGGLLFIGLGAFYLFATWGQYTADIYLIITGLPCAVGLLYILDWRFEQLWA